MKCITVPNALKTVLNPRKIFALLAALAAILCIILLVKTTQYTSLNRKYFSIIKLRREFASTTDIVVPNVPGSITTDKVVPEVPGSITTDIVVPKVPGSITTDIVVPEVPGYISYPANETLKLHCSTCAYVTGSGHLIGSKKGEEIDSMECVFRSNNAPVTGFQEDVGTRTTLRTGDRNSLRYITEQVLKDHGKFDPNIVAQPSTIVLAYSEPYSKLYEQLAKSHDSLPDLALYVFTREKFHDITDIFAERVSGNGVWASNGFMTIYFAHEVCDVIHVYGINEEKFCEKVFANETGYTDLPYHYYPKNSGLKNCAFIKYLDGGTTQTHHFTKEKAHYRLLIKEWGNIHFHSPEWSED